MEKHGKWLDEEYEYLIGLIKQHPEHTYKDYADKMTDKFNVLFTPDGVRHHYKRSQKNKINFLDRKNTEDNVEKYFELLVESQRQLQQFDDRQTTINLDIDDDKPIGIAFTGDWHVGGLYTAHQKMRDDFRIMGMTEGLYNIAMGDYADNYNSGSHKGGQYEQISNPDKQKKIIEYLFDYLKGNNIAVIKGNHDNWETRETSEDFTQFIARKIESPHLWYGGTINIRLGEQVYKVVARHSYLGGSALNSTNSQRRLFDETHGDVIALGHLHYNESHAKSRGGKDTVWIRTGTYKGTDDYSQWVGGFRGDFRQPMVVIFPDTKKIIDFRDMYDGIAYLKMVRNKQETTSFC